MDRMIIGRYYIFRDGKLIWTPRYPDWDGQNWITAEERRRNFFLPGDVISYELWTGGDFVLDGGLV